MNSVVDDTTETGLERKASIRAENIKNVFLTMNRVDVLIRQERWVHLELPDRRAAKELFRKFLECIEQFWNASKGGQP
jgi:hypothetical protein